ncbi:uncharacterized protein MCYG_07448 [Microsporum canis CBS 113480]|uniref:Uncharacterized protein n=1 Tax=Arthroderma otae (strain ATCC MYA-4605 / CBS 113480) TaxID=554155 RepID=C5FYN1_ARTOC|nr:uncharacterized protein MCYG_07448 [Microsporum canis CBS 113480]EEQ34629.1 predicted protein [Microsporum canis CBS 113480]
MWFLSVGTDVSPRSVWEDCPLEPWISYLPGPIRRRPDAVGRTEFGSQTYPTAEQQVTSPVEAKRKFLAVATFLQQTTEYSRREVSPPPTHLLHRTMKGGSTGFPDGERKEHPPFLCLDVGMMQEDGKRVLLTRRIHKSRLGVHGSLSVRETRVSAGSWYPQLRKYAMGYMIKIECKRLSRWPYSSSCSKATSFTTLVRWRTEIYPKTLKMSISTRAILSMG